MKYPKVWPAKKEKPIFVFPVDYWLGETPEEYLKVHRPKCCDYNYQDKGIMILQLIFNGMSTDLGLFYA